MFSWYVLHGRIHVDERGSSMPFLLNCPASHQVLTSDVKGSGTDANVFINLVGEGGETGEHALAANYDTFERAQVGDRGVMRSINKPLLMNRPPTPSVHASSTSDRRRRTSSP